VSRPGHNLPPGKTRYPLYRGLGGPQGRSGRVRKISPSPGFDPWTIQPIGSRCTDYATGPTNSLLSIIKKEWYMLLKWKSVQPNPVILCASFMLHRFTVSSASQLARSHTRTSAEVTALLISNSTISQLSLCFHTHKPLTII